MLTAVILISFTQLCTWFKSFKVPAQTLKPHTQTSNLMHKPLNLMHKPLNLLHKVLKLKHKCDIFQSSRFWSYKSPKWKISMIFYKNTYTRPLLMFLCTFLVSQNFKQSCLFLQNQYFLVLKVEQKCAATYQITFMLLLLIFVLMN